MHQNEIRTQEKSGTIYIEETKKAIALFKNRRTPGPEGGLFRVN